MAKSKETFAKKDKEKKRKEKLRAKQERKELRQAHAHTSQGSSEESMMAYVDENGDLTDDPYFFKKVKALGAHHILTDTMPAVVEEAEEEDHNRLHSGKVLSFNSEKGYGFISDHVTKQTVFIHINNLTGVIAQNDRVEYEMRKGKKGMEAFHLRKVQ